ncbi:M24 family metallopeptidase [Desulfonatronovibrio hydrogenovorans]|uniref:M24 family metallopeptidase n=1 Tax=Desulfonatronovibrio hydrogenovorans TaxID=53245 RepID=UPI00048C2DB9|nr:Xaa-Pro peptidase family protein [Desulfonatronovibrio hydrogenovorans]
MMDHQYLSRMQKLRAKMQDQGIDFFLVQSPANRFYLSGFELFDPQCNESAGCLLVSLDRTVLMTDPRYLEAGKEFFSAEDIFVYSGSKFDRINEYLIECGVQDLAFEPQWMAYDFFESLKKKFRLRPCKGLMEDLRLIKDAQEIELMRQSCSLNHKVFSLIEKKLEPGMTEIQVAWEVERMFRENGASGLSFPTIAASGPRAALPHAIPLDVPIRNNDVLLLDMGCRLNDYCSDQTRTFWIGDHPGPEFIKTRELVLEAQTLAIDNIEPGMPVREAYNLVRSFFEKKGVHDHFTHALGHGIGLETHEPPGIGPNADLEFSPGMVITVEPGLYYPEWGGVRWEYMVLITSDGAEIL